MNIIVVDKFVSIEENKNIELFVVLKLFTICASMWARQQEVYCFVYEMRKLIKILAKVPVADNGTVIDIVIIVLNALKECGEYRIEPTGINEIKQHNEIEAG